jgi:hypothetical protein
MNAKNGEKRKDLIICLLLFGFVALKLGDYCPLPIITLATLLSFWQRYLRSRSIKGLTKILFDFFFYHYNLNLENWRKSCAAEIKDFLYVQQSILDFSISMRESSKKRWGNHAVGRIVHAKMLM